MASYSLHNFSMVAKLYGGSLIETSSRGRHYGGVVLNTHLPITTARHKARQPEMARDLSAMNMMIRFFAFFCPTHNPNSCSPV